MTKLAPEWVRTSDPVIRSPARYRWTTAPASPERKDSGPRHLLLHEADRRSCHHPRSRNAACRRWHLYQVLHLFPILNQILNISIGQNMFNHVLSKWISSGRLSE